MPHSLYPRHQYALIAGVRSQRIIIDPEQEDPDVWKESPADLVDLSPVANDLSGNPNSLEEVRFPGGGSLANLVTDCFLKPPAPGSFFANEENFAKDDNPSEGIAAPIGGTPASRKAAKKARKAAQALSAAAEVPEKEAAEAVQTER